MDSGKNLPPTIVSTLEGFGQEHLIDHLEILDECTRQALIDRILKINWAGLKNTVEPGGYVDVKRVSPSRVISLDERTKRCAELEKAGQTQYRERRVAVVVVAGGQATRLGFDAPKGCFPFGPISGDTLFKTYCDKVFSASERYGYAVPMLIMTSPATDKDTRSFFVKHNNFGLAAEQVRIFCQDTVPTCDGAGRAMLAAPGRLLENPNGHGGCATALYESGTLQWLKTRGHSYIVYIQVDNPMACVDDPVLMGVLSLEGAEIVTKVVNKSAPNEKVGALVRVDGRDCVVEYSDLTPEQEQTKDAEGRYLFRWGNTANHGVSVEFLLQVNEKLKGGQAAGVLPYHMARKKVKAWVDGEVAECQSVKRERFFFDLMLLTEHSVGLEIDRALEFAPVKNDNTAGFDCPSTALQLINDRNKRWLQAVGVDVTQAGSIEISPRFAATSEQFQERWDKRTGKVTGNLYIA